PPGPSWPRRRSPPRPARGPAAAAVPSSSSAPDRPRPDLGGVRPAASTPRGMIAGGMDLQSPVQFVKGVGPQRAAALQALNVATAEDLLFHLTMRYEDRRAFARVADLRAGMKVSVSGTISVAGLRRARRLTLYEVRLEDGTGRLKALWFNQPFLKDTLPRGAQVVLYGTVEPDAYGSRQLMMSSPQYEKVESEDAAGVHTGRIVPVYEKLGPLTGKVLRR